FKDRAADVLGAWIEALKISAFRKIANAEPAPRANAHPMPLGGAGSALGFVIGGHKLGCPRRPAQTDLGTALGAVVDAHVAVAVLVFSAAGREGGGHGGGVSRAHTAARQSSASRLTSSGSASKASSSRRTSHTLRPSMSFAGPTRPSLRNSSNLEGEMPR